LLDLLGASLPGPQSRRTVTRGPAYGLSWGILYVGFWPYVVWVIFPAQSGCAGGSRGGCRCEAYPTCGLSLGPLLMDSVRWICPLRGSSNDPPEIGLHRRPQDGPRVATYPIHRSGAYRLLGRFLRCKSLLRGFLNGCSVSSA